MQHGDAGGTVGRGSTHVKPQDLRAVQVDAVLVGGGATETEGLGNSQAVRYCPPSIPGYFQGEGSHSED